jgi:hypothetical protein
MRHEGHQIYGITDLVEHRFMRQAQQWDDLANMVLPVRAMSSRLHATIHQADDFSFRAIDAMPQVTQAKILSIEDFAHFAPPLARTREIIVPDESVSDLMARILEMQQPERTEYFKRQLREDRDGRMLDAMPRQKFHAQIVSIAA